MSLQIHRILHAGYQLRSGQTAILMDPIFENPFSQNCFAYPEVQFDLGAIGLLQVDAVLISHFHDDHCSFESLNLLDRAIPIYLYCIHERLFTLLNELGFRQLIRLRVDQTVEIGEFKITPRKALQPEVDSMFQVQVNGLNILNVVDAEIDTLTLQKLRDQPRWDLVLWPFQIMRETDVLDPRRAQEPNVREILRAGAKQIQSLNPRILIPSSCQFRMDEGSWYNGFYFATSYREFSKSILAGIKSNGAEPKQELKIQRLNPGEGYELTGTSFDRIESLHWIKPLGDQSVDYQLDSVVKFPRTRDVAKGFSALTKAQRVFTKRFLCKELPLRFAKIGAAAGLLFNQRRLWELIVYRSGEEADHFIYLLDSDEMTFLHHQICGPQESGVEGASAPRRHQAANTDHEVEWLTEISEFKLHSAVQEGEALNSILVRVNDREFAPAIELLLAETDVMDDPLIRCLYSQDLFAYQAQQLRRLSERGAREPEAQSLDSSR